MGRIPNNKQSTFVKYIIFSRGTFEFARARWQITQYFKKIDRKTRKICQIYIWNPMTTGFIMLTLICVNQYGISSPESQTFLRAKRLPSRAKSEEKRMFSRAINNLTFG